jgi:hypothetical protein
MIRQYHDTDYKPPVIEVSTETDPIECAKARQQRAQFDRNSAWLQKHIPEVYAPENRGKIVCIAGEEAFFGDTVEEVAARASAAHPDDSGSFMRYIPRQRMIWVYAT